MSHATAALEAAFRETLEQADIDSLSSEYQQLLFDARAAAVALVDAVAEKRITPEEALASGEQLLAGAKSLALAGALDARTKTQEFALRLVGTLFKLAVNAALPVP